MSGRVSPSAYWSTVRDSLEARPRNELDGTELDRLADALFWLDEPWVSCEVRREAYRRHLDDGDEHLAALAAWRLFYEHHLVGEAAVARGWVERCAHHVETARHEQAAGWLEIARTDLAWGRGDAQAALGHARRAHQLARQVADPDLAAMAGQALGRAEIACHRPEDGVRLLDETMVSVVNEELDPHFTGWVFCNVIAACMDLADLRRASEWSDAALRWCGTLQEGRLYPGLCRVYAVELALLRGDWDDAETEAGQACEHLAAYDPRYAGAAVYLMGEVARLRGRHDEAAAAYDRAYALGHPSQPGRALLAAAQGRPAEARAGLRAALPTIDGTLLRAWALVAAVELELDGGSVDEARRAAADLATLAERSPGEVLGRLAEGVSGLVLAAGAAGPVAAPASGIEALSRLRGAAGALRALGVPHEAARFHRAAARVALALGDGETARLELGAAQRLFHQLGAVDDLRTVTEPPAQQAGAGLTERELEVLELVAAGATNRDIAGRLHLSRHTVSRHLSNIFAKLGVHSRAAAASAAHEHGLFS